MKTFKSGKEKLEEIVTVLRKETLEPAQEEGKRIIAQAKAQAEHIIHQAQTEANSLVEEAQKSIERERTIFHSSLTQAAQQSIEAMRQAIEKKLFNEELHQLVNKEMSSKDLIAKLITALVKAIEKEGLNANLEAIIPQTVSAKEVAQLLAETIVNKLKNHTVQLGEFIGGAKVRLENKRVTVEITNKEIEELLKRYVRKDFRALFFGKS